MSDRKTKAMIASTFLEMVGALEIGQYGKKSVIGFTSEDNEHSQDNIEETMKIAEVEELKAVLIEGEDLHEKMRGMPDSGEIDGTVTMHYPFPIGVSTVGKVVTPGRRKSMYIATATGTSDAGHISNMVKNAIYGIIATKADGMGDPTVGIVNIDGVHQTEKALLKLAESDYDINFAESVGADGGIAMRGNDLLGRTPDVMVISSSTDNLMMKVFSSYTIGGNYESLGFDYGPGMGEGYDRLIMIVSRASGASVITGTMEYATSLTRHDWREITDGEFEKANRARLKGIISELKSTGKKDAGAAAEEVKMPPKEVVTSRISGIEVMDLEDAVKALWKAGIYAENDIGYTDPIVLMPDANEDKAHETLKATGYVN